MRLNITAQPMYEDGTIGGEDPPMGCEATLHANDHAAIGAFLAEQAAWWIGTEEDVRGQKVRCDALDITISEVREGT